MVADLVELSKIEVPKNCLEVAYEVSIKSGIIFQRDHAFRKPIEKIEVLKTAPTFLIPDGFDTELLGKPFTGQHEALSKKILSACVILVLKDCRPDDCEKWESQTCIEETYAVEEEIKRLENEDSLIELLKGFQYKPKRW